MFKFGYTCWCGCWIVYFDCCFVVWAGFGFPRLSVAWVLILFVLICWCFDLMLWFGTLVTVVLCCCEFWVEWVLQSFALSLEFWFDCYDCLLL